MAGAHVAKLLYEQQLMLLLLNVYQLMHISRHMLLLSALLNVLCCLLCWVCFTLSALLGALSLFLHWLQIAVRITQLLMQLRLLLHGLLFSRDDVFILLQWIWLLGKPTIDLVCARTFTSS
uniref:Uncharacterized protein n=1 Tax=Kalanchoe fedtschenkoi TaxID=63787 RepID=A0A7N0U480_KALFE